MSAEKRPRGRPRGSGKNDAPFLAQIADVLLRDVTLKPTTAMRRLINGGRDWDATDETLLRRWQVKWKEQGHLFMAAARERTRPRPPAPAEIDLMQSVLNVKDLPALKQWDEAIQAVQNSPALRQWSELAEKLQNSPQLRQWSELAERLQTSPQLRQWSELAERLQNSPQLRQWGELAERLQNSCRVTRKPASGLRSHRRQMIEELVGAQGLEPWTR